MIPKRNLYAKFTVSVVPSPEEKRLEFRKKRYKRRMVLAGLRPASIERYLTRGFKGLWAKAMQSEMQRLIWDIKYRSFR